MRSALLRSLLVSLLALTVVGCADRGVLQLDLTLPEQQAAIGSAGRPVVLRYAAIQLRSGQAETTIFDAPWSNEETTQVIELAEGAPTRVRVDIEVGAGAADGPISGKLIFCGESSCGRDGANPDVSEWLLFERAAYVGAVTRIELDRSGGPTTSDAASGPTEVDRCEVEGCNQGIAAPSYCVDDRHLCEAS